MQVQSTSKCGSYVSNGLPSRKIDFFKKNSSKFALLIVHSKGVDLS